MTKFPKIAGCFSCRISKEVFEIRISRFFAAAISAAILIQASGGFIVDQSIDTFAESEPEQTIYNITFLDFDGNIIQTLVVEAGETIDYSLIDTSQLDVHLDKYTERRFSSWDITPETADEDLVIQALYEEAQIQLISMPNQTEFYDKSGAINLNGLKVTITLTTQTSQYDSEGNRIINESVVDVAESCYTSPADLYEAFADGDTATISIFPISSNIPLASYDITYYPNLGDINFDDKITAVDASIVLSYYAYASVMNDAYMDEEQFYRADINRDGKITAVDSASILSYYALSAVDGDPRWENFISK